MVLLLSVALIVHVGVPVPACELDCVAVKVPLGLKEELRVAVWLEELDWVLVVVVVQLGDGVTVREAVDDCVLVVAWLEVPEVVKEGLEEGVEHDEGVEDSVPDRVLLMEEVCVPLEVETCERDRVTEAVIDSVCETDESCVIDIDPVTDDDMLRE